MKNTYDTFSTPLGNFSVAVDETGAVIATAFGGLTELKKRLDVSPGTRDAEATRKAREQILTYFAGDLRKFTLKLNPKGTPFQKSVWAALHKIPFGKTRSYGDIAAELGNPKASRAVGGANGSNPICLIAPCHRVIGANGSLTGFAFGEKIKQRLLEHESATGVQPLKAK